MKHPRFEIIAHGPEHSQYFHGCGTSSTSYTHVVTGTGDNAKDAYEDCVDQIYMMHDAAIVETLHLPKRPHGIRKDDKVPNVPAGAHWNEPSDFYYFVSIRYTIPE